MNEPLGRMVGFYENPLSIFAGSNTAVHYTMDKNPTPCMYFTFSNSGFQIRNLYWDGKEMGCKYDWLIQRIETYYAYSAIIDKIGIYCNNWGESLVFRDNKIIVLRRSSTT